MQFINVIGRYNDSANRCNNKSGGNTDISLLHLRLLHEHGVHEESYPSLPLPALHVTWSISAGHQVVKPLQKLVVLLVEAVHLFLVYLRRLRPRQQPAMSTQYSVQLQENNLRQGTVPRTLPMKETSYEIWIYYSDGTNEVTHKQPPRRGASHKHSLHLVCITCAVFADFSVTLKNHTATKNAQNDGKTQFGT